MLKGGVAKRYARAVFELALEDNDLEKWDEDLKQIAEAVEEPDIAGALANNRIPLDNRRQIVEERLPQISEHALNLVSLLLTKSRVQLIGSIRDEFILFSNEHNGIEVADVTTAVSLNQQEKEALAKHLEEVTGKKIILETKIDEAIIGGMIARIGDKVIDGSTRTRLIALRQSLAGIAR